MAAPWPRSTRWRRAKLLFATAWSAAVAIAGLWLWEQPHAIAFAAGLAGLAGGTLCFMWFVADDLCPEAPMEATGFLKGFAGALFGLSLAWALLLAIMHAR